MCEAGHLTQVYSFRIHITEPYHIYIVHDAKLLLFVGALCESLQQTAQLSADMHYTWICMNTMTSDDDDDKDDDN